MIYLLRHGLDDERYIGGYSDVGLINQGFIQVEEATELMIKKCKFNRIISSDVKRAKETAQIVSKKFNIPIEYDSMLRELNKGKLNGMLKENAKIYYPDYVDVKDINVEYPDGESMVEFYERIQNCLERILKLDNTLLITHRGVINMIYYLLTETPLDMDKEKFGVTHASIHELNPKTKTIRKVEK